MALFALLLCTSHQITQQSEAMSDQAKQLEAARHATSQEGAAADARVRALQQGARKHRHSLGSPVCCLDCHAGIVVLAVSVARLHLCPQTAFNVSTHSITNLMADSPPTEVLLQCCAVRCAFAATAELASFQMQHGNLQRELNQLRAMTAEKDERLADAAGGERQMWQQLEQLRQQLREAGEAHGRMLLLWVVGLSGGLWLRGV